MYLAIFELGLMIRICLFYKLTPKILGALPHKKNWGPKTCKISVDFIQPPTLIANISAKIGEGIIFNNEKSYLIDGRKIQEILVRLKISKIEKLIHRRQFILRYVKKVR